MEEEAYFLFIVYYLSKTDAKLDEKTSLDQYNNYVEIRRATMQKNVRDEREVFQRIHVDFEPLNEHVVYVVTCYTRYENKNIINTHYPKCVGVFTDEHKAISFLEQVKEGKHRDLLEERQIFESADVQVVLITQR